MSEDDKLFTDGRAYEQLMGRWSRIVAVTFLDWLDAPKNLNWLDVGCGNGAFTEEIIARCAPAAVSAIDPSDDQLAYARKRPGVTMVEFRLADAENLPFGDVTFDVATMALVISFIPDPERAVAEMVRATDLMPLGPLEPTADRVAPRPSRAIPSSRTAPIRQLLGERRHRFARVSAPASKRRSRL